MRLFGLPIHGALLAILAAISIVAVAIIPISSANEVRSNAGVVTTRTELASMAGVGAMEQGGNAIDSIVAAGFALAVTHPAAGNIGGGGFMVIRLADGQVFTNDHREVAPLAAHRDMFLDADGNYDPQKARSSHQASGVPGSVAGLLDVHERFGVLSRAQVMAEAIRLASEGFELPEDTAEAFAARLDAWMAHPGSKEIFLKSDESVYEPGELFVQEDLAETLMRIRDAGKAGFYEGKTADLIVAEMERGNGLISHEDLEKYGSVWREPVAGTYRGFKVFSMPPPSSGGVLLIQMLNMLEPFDLGAMGSGSASTIHLMVEAERRAYADRAIHLGDSDFYPVPLATLADKNYANSRMENFNAESATPSELIGEGEIPLESEETTHLSAIDKHGNAVSFTTTINSGYGNRIVVQGAGFLLNNEMDDFSSKPGTPNQFGLLGAEANAIEPRKRMLSSMTPTIVVKEEKPVLVTGSPGGSTIITTVLQVVVNTIDHGMSVKDSVDSPRFHHQWKPNVIQVERGRFPETLLDELRKLGHDVRERGTLGVANSAGWHDGLGVAISDPRRPLGNAMSATAKQDDSEED